MEVQRNGLLFSTSSELADELLVSIGNCFLLQFLIRCYSETSFSAFHGEKPVFYLLCLVHLTCHTWIVFYWAMSHQMLFKDFPSNCDELNSLRKGAGASVRWATEWEEHAKPLLMEASCLFLFCGLLYDLMTSSARVFAYESPSPSRQPCLLCHFLSSSHELIISTFTFLFCWNEVWASNLFRLYLKGPADLLTLFQTLGGLAR